MLGSVRLPADRTVLLCAAGVRAIREMYRPEPVPLRPRIPDLQRNGGRRHAITSLFASLNLAAEGVISRC